MEYSIDKVARMAGITSRTLRHYDAIGLLKPRRVSGNGYRVYGTAEIDRLQQILFYRELELELGEIRTLLDDPHFDRTATLGRHLTELTDRRARIDGLIAAVQKTMQYVKGEIEMTDHEKFEAFKAAAIAENETRYGREVREKYGDARVEESNRLYASLTHEQMEAMQKAAAEIQTRLNAAVRAGVDPTGEEGRAIAELHRDWLGYTWPTYSPEAHRGLGELYLADERFTAYYDSEVTGCAQFLKEAIDGMTSNK